MSEKGVAAPRIRLSATVGEVGALAAHDLSSALAAMLGAAVASSPDDSLTPSEIRIDLGNSTAPSDAPPITLDADSFDIARTDGSIIVRTGNERGLIHAASSLLEQLGAMFPPGVAPLYPHIDDARLAALEPYRVAP